MTLPPKPRGRPPKDPRGRPPNPRPSQSITLNPWTPEGIRHFREAFSDFCGNLTIDSKETGGESPLILNGAQTYFLDELFDGLSQGIHNFVFLKARQLGCTTICVALDLFWLFYFDGTKGGIVFNNDDTRSEFRVTIDRFIASLPATHRAGVSSNARHGITFGQGSRLSFLVAGVKKSTASAHLGKGLGLSFCHATEVGAFGDPKGIASLKAALAKKNPNRLFIWESTAEGFNDFNTMWVEALEDPASKAVFIGWWRNQQYRYSTTDPEEAALYARYSYPLTPEETEVQETVERLYHFTLTLNQWAWYRHNSDPTAGEEENAGIESENVALFRQNYPSFADEAFLLSGAKFFGSGALTAAYKEARKVSYKGFRYILGEKFTDMRLEYTNTARLADLKVWEEPDPEGVYVIGADPAYGSSDDADRYVVQVLRCYADGVDQVAEYCTPNIATYQFAWVLLHLCATYTNCRYLLEITGPGEAVWNEMRHVRTLVETGYLRDDAEEKGLYKIFSNIKAYIYTRTDSMGGGGAWCWKSSPERKVSVYSGMRDSLYLGQLRIRSLECLEEMKRIVQDGLSIQGDGSSKDDRPMALALATRCWMEYERKAMIGQHRTRDVEESKKTRTRADEYSLFQQFIMRETVEGNAAQRARADADARKGRRWR